VRGYGSKFTIQLHDGLVIASGKKLQDDLADEPVDDEYPHIDVHAQAMFELVVGEFDRTLAGEVFDGTVRHPVRHFGRARTTASTFSCRATTTPNEGPVQGRTVKPLRSKKRRATSLASVNSRPMP